MSLFRLLQHYYPDSEWSCPADLVRDNWDRVQWFGPGAKPTLAEIDALPAPPEPVPETITRYQMLVALRRAGRLQDARNWIADPATDPEHALAVEHLTVFRRTSPTIAALAAHLGYGASAIDTLFRNAAGIDG